MKNNNKARALPVSDLPDIYKSRYGWRLFTIRTVYIFMKLFWRIEVDDNFATCLSTEDREPVVLIANHQNFFDVPLIILALNPWVDWVCKCELFNIPLFGKFLQEWAAIPFDRSKVDLTAIKTIIQRLKAKRIVGIFPQGHRCRTEAELMQYRASATIVGLIRKAEAKVLVVGISGDFKFRSKIRLSTQKAFKLEERYNAGQSDDEIAYDLLKSAYDLAKRPYPAYSELKSHELQTK